jgi:glycosyltransferase involved in cell wall biosynthesis
MKVLFLTPSASRAAGGIFEIERRLAQCLSGQSGVEISVLCLEDEYTAADLSSWLPLRPQVCATSGPRTFGYSSQMRSAASHSTADLAHLHALWMFPSVVLRHWHRRKSRPYLITLNGMLELWAIRNSAWKKRIALTLFERANLDDAACIQVNSEAELNSARNFGLKNPIAIIPNGIDLPHSVESSELRADSSVFDRFAQGRKVLLYLGRIHPKKGLVNLIRAWKTTINCQPSTNGWLLAIAGWDQGGHEEELKLLARELGLSFVDVRDQKSTVSGQWPLVFLGPQFGDSKAVCYQNCDAFILPSFSEGLPMVVLEAWAYGKPVLMTPECNLPEGFAANAAIRIETTVEGIGGGLWQLFEMSADQRNRMGANGLDLVARQFTWPKIARDLKSVYDWVLGSGAKPECVMKV